MRSSPALPLLVVALLVAGSVGVAVGQTTPTATPTGETADSGVTLTVQLEPDGDARWNVSARFPLRSANETNAFEQLAEEFRNGETSFGDVSVFETAASEASLQTSREMAVRNDERSVHGSNATGTLSLTFTWTNFSQVSGERLVVGDVFAAGSDTWLPRLTADQTLVIRPPDGYTVHSAESTPGAQIDNRNLIIRGPATFERGQPSITYAGGGTDKSWWPLPIDSTPLLLFVLLLSAAVAGVYVWARKGEGPLDGLLAGDEDAEGVEDIEPPGTVVEEPPVEADAGEPADEDEAVDPALLSDEERVLRLLEDNGGRMKQATIVKETGWSNAKVSQLLSAMDEDGQVDKLRIGRENLISLPDEGFGEIE